MNTWLFPGAGYSMRYHHSCMSVQVVAEGEDIVYTYDVYWQESSVEWASRWDAYLRMPNGTVHWFSILNSLLVVLVMSVIVAVILMRTVRRDLAKYEELLVEGQVCPRPSAQHVC